MTRQRKVRPPIQPCIQPGCFYRLTDLVEGGIAGKSTFAEWIKHGLPRLMIGTNNYIIAADDLIAFWREMDKQKRQATSGSNGNGT